MKSVYVVADSKMKIRISCILLCLLVSTALSDEDVDDEATVETVEQPVIAVQYQSPIVTDPTKVYLAEHFDDLDQVQKRWIKSQAKKEGIAEEEIAKYDGVWSVEAAARDALTGDSGLVLKSKAKHAAIAAALDRPFVFEDKPLVVQYEVLLQEGQECGGAYLKLLSENGPGDLSLFHDKTPYTIMFGPDKCGNDHKLHFIFRHRNPLNGTVEEKHCRKPDERIEEYFSDKLPHLYTLVVWPQNTYEIKVDGKIVNTGHLLMDFEPPVNPPKEIDDVTDTKPEHWDDREKIPDPEATKPLDWDEDAPAQIVDESAVKPEGWLEDEPTHVPDSDAVKPADWDTEMDGEWEPPLVENPACAEAVGCGPWEPPLINNPAFKGKWRPPTIDNPNYRGKWRPGRIPNPDYFEEKHPFRMPNVTAVGFELWSMSQDILFDNIIITDDIVVAAAWAAETFDKKRQKIAKDSESVVQRLANLTNEYPALWGVYILVLAVPVVFLLYICCKPSSSAASSGQRQEREEEQEEEAEKKKTDEMTEDVEEEEVDMGKEDVVEAEGEEDEDREKNSEPDSEEDNEQHAEVGAGETADSGDKPSSDGGARKRKVRKE